MKSCVFALAVGIVASNLFFGCSSSAPEVSAIRRDASRHPYESNVLLTGQESVPCTPIGNDIRGDPLGGRLIEVSASYVPTDPAGGDANGRGELFITVSPIVGITCPLAQCVTLCGGRYDAEARHIVESKLELQSALGHNSVETHCYAVTWPEKYDPQLPMVARVSFYETMGCDDVVIVLHRE
jgi:hypothetical protein